MRVIICVSNPHNKPESMCHVQHMAYINRNEKKEEKKLVTKKLFLKSPSHRTSAPVHQKRDASVH
jgi:hypothetical protein